MNFHMPPLRPLATSLQSAFGPVFELELRVWPGPSRLAAHLDFHGNWIEWLL